MTNYPDVGDTLANASLRQLQVLFRDRGLSMTKKTTKAFKTTFDTMQTLLSTKTTFEGRKYHLVSMDPGMGKTDAICNFLDVWKSHHFMPSGGVVVCVSRLTEIDDYIRRSGLDETDYAVWTADDELNAKGRQQRQDAPVLFTTQQKVLAACGSGSFEANEAFHYKGRPRQLRIWDEAILPAEPIAVRLDTCTSMLELLRPINPVAAQMVEQFAEDVRKVGSGANIKCPAKLWTAAREVKKASGVKDHKHLDLIKSISGKTVTVYHGNGKGWQLVAHANRLPGDLAPMIVLDASGRVRQTYKVWSKYRDDLNVLVEVPAEYGDLKVHHWGCSASRSAFAVPETRSQVVKVVADLIDADEDQQAPWLVIHYMASSGVDIEADLKAMVTGDAARLKFVHWGRHHGTNDYRDVDRVVILGLNHTDHWVPLGLLQTFTTEPMDKAEQDVIVQALKVGEYRHDMLQAVCRSSIRKRMGKPCHVYLIGRAGVDIVGMLHETFPGCQVVTWTPVHKELSGRSEQVVEAVLEAFTDPAIIEVRKGAIRAAVGFSSGPAMSQVLRLPGLVQYLMDIGIEMTTRAFRRLPEVPAAFA